MIKFTRDPFANVSTIRQNNLIYKEMYPSPSYHTNILNTRFIPPEVFTYNLVANRYIPFLSRSNVPNIEFYSFEFRRFNRPVQFALRSATPPLSLSLSRARRLQLRHRVLYRQ